ncbi:hypothetical protein TrVFT333_001808 [Trichoderma virens FT-333]|nr:hypothetical protein TrVFT333_001808 [Trichoderma virens FT-333]
MVSTTSWHAAQKKKNILGILWRSFNEHILGRMSSNKPVKWFRQPHAMRPKIFFGEYCGGFKGIGGGASMNIIWAACHQRNSSKGLGKIMACGPKIFGIHGKWWRSFNFNNSGSHAIR